MLVIGGGQAGLAMGYHLAQRGLRFLIVDAGAEIGAAWRSRWDSLRLFTPAQYDNLPGLPFPAAPDTYPGKDDVADYLQAYAAEFELPVRLNTTVTSLTTSDGGYVAKAGDDDAGGPAGGGRHRALPGAVHPADRRPSSTPTCTRSTAPTTGAREPLPPGRVLVVGAANSGCQIALELSAHPPRRALRRPADPDDPAAAAGPRRLVVGEPGCGWTGSPRTRGWDSGWPGGTR